MKKSTGPTILSDTVQQAWQLGGGDLVVDGLTPALTGEEAATLHEPQMSAGLVLFEFTERGELADGVFTLRQQFRQAEADGMGHRLQAGGRVGQDRKREQARFL
jgi:hypothetical protein